MGHYRGEKVSEQLQTVYMVVHELQGGNECGAVVSIWTEKEDAEKERHRLHSMESIGGSWTYEVYDAPLNTAGTATLN